MSVHDVFHDVYVSPMTRLVTRVEGILLGEMQDFGQPVESPVEAGDTFHEPFGDMCHRGS